MQDEARSFRSKTGAIKIILRADGSRKAFQNFLKKTHQKGEEELVDYYMSLEVVRKIIDKKKFRDEAMQLIHTYKARADKKDSAAEMIYETLHSWKGLENLTDEEFKAHMTRSAEEVVGILSPLFEKFVASKDYGEWTKEEKALERKKSVQHEGPLDQSTAPRRAASVRRN